MYPGRTGPFNTCCSAPRPRAAVVAGAPLAVEPHREENIALDRTVAPTAHRHRVDQSRPLPFPSPTHIDQLDPDGKIAIFYASVLLALAILLETVLVPPSTHNTGTKAA